MLLCKRGIPGAMGVRTKEGHTPREQGQGHAHADFLVSAKTMGIAYVRKRLKAEERAQGQGRAAHTGPREGRHRAKGGAAQGQGRRASQGQGMQSHAAGRGRRREQPQVRERYTTVARTIREERGQRKAAQWPFRLGRGFPFTTGHWAHITKGEVLQPGRELGGVG